MEIGKSGITRASFALVGLLFVRSTTHPLLVTERTPALSQPLMVIVEGKS